MGFLGVLGLLYSLIPSPMEITFVQPPGEVEGVVWLRDTVLVGGQDSVGTSWILRIPGGLQAPGDTLFPPEPLLALGIWKNQAVVLTPSALRTVGSFQPLRRFSPPLESGRFVGQPEVLGILTPHRWIPLDSSLFPVNSKDPILTVQLFPPDTMLVVTAKGLEMFLGKSRRFLSFGAFQQPLLTDHRLCALIGPLYLKFPWGFAGFGGYYKDFPGHEGVKASGREEKTFVDSSRLIAFSWEGDSSLWSLIRPGKVTGLFPYTDSLILALFLHIPRFESHIDVIHAREGKILRTLEFPLPYFAGVPVDPGHLLLISADLRFDLFALGNFPHSLFSMYPYTIDRRYGRLLGFYRADMDHNGELDLLFWGESLWDNPRRNRFYGFLRFHIHEACDSIYLLVHRSHALVPLFTTTKHLQQIDQALEGAVFLLPDSLPSFQKRREEILRYLHLRSQLLSILGMVPWFLMLAFVVGLILIVLAKKTQPSYYEPPCFYVERLERFINYVLHKMRKIEYKDPCHKGNVQCDDQNILNEVIQNLEKEKITFLRLSAPEGFWINLGEHFRKGSGRYLFSFLKRALENPTKESLKKTYELLENLRTQVRDIRLKLIEEIKRSVLETQEQFRSVRFHLSEDVDIDRPPPCIPPSIRGPLLSLVRAVLQNAAEAVENLDDHLRQVRVTLRTSQDHLLVEIQDEGPGIAVQPWQAIFEEGFSTKNSGSGGRGHGLTPDLLRFIKKYGTLLVEGKDPQGTVFTIIIDYKKILGNEHQEEGDARET